MVPRLVKKFLQFFHTLMFITKFTRSHWFFNVKYVCYNFIFINLKCTNVGEYMVFEIRTLRIKCSAL